MNLIERILNKTHNQLFLVLLDLLSFSIFLVLPPTPARHAQFMPFNILASTLCHFCVTNPLPSSHLGTSTASPLTTLFCLYFPT